MTVIDGVQRYHIGYLDSSHTAYNNVPLRWLVTEQCCTSPLSDPPHLAYFNDRSSREMCSALGEVIDTNACFSTRHLRSRAYVLVSVYG